MPTEQSEQESLSTLHNKVMLQCQVITGNIKNGCFFFFYLKIAT